jgi:hypothetical protein
MSHHSDKVSEDRHELCGEARERNPSVVGGDTGSGAAASPSGSPTITYPHKFIGLVPQEPKSHELRGDGTSRPKAWASKPEWIYREDLPSWDGVDSWFGEPLLATSWRPKFEVPKGKRWYSAQEITASDGCWGRVVEYGENPVIKKVSTGRPVGRPRKGMQQPWEEITQLVNILVMNQSGKELLGSQLNLDRIINIGEIARRTKVSKSNLYHWRDRYPAPRPKPSLASQAWLRQLGVGNNLPTSEEEKVNAAQLQAIREGAYEGAKDAFYDAMTNIEIARYGHPAEEAEEVLAEDDQCPD